MPDLLPRALFLRYRATSDRKGFEVVARLLDLVDRQHKALAAVTHPDALTAERGVAAWEEADALVAEVEAQR